MYSITTVISATAITAFVLTGLLGFVFVPFLRRLKFGQTIKDIGPTWHKSKEGTPTMGGIIFILGIITACITGYILLRSTNEYGVEYKGNFTEDIMFFASLIFAFLMGLIGFADDFIKVVKKRNLGLSAKQKTLFQFAVIVLFIAVDIFVRKSTQTSFDIPFTSAKLPLWYFYYPVLAIAIYFMVNAVNLTDGIDGLAASVTFVAGLGYMIAANIMGSFRYEVLATALAAGCLGFLIWNVHPARVFMGDTGSMFLGGLVVSLGLGTNQFLLLIFFGFIYIVEALSVVLQVISFKLFGRRIFKMSPIHHHFEMKGWSEVKIVLVFSAVAAAASLLGVIGAYNYSLK